LFHRVALALRVAPTDRRTSSCQESASSRPAVIAFIGAAEMRAVVAFLEAVIWCQTHHL
jgi:hypothetical protein